MTKLIIYQSLVGFVTTDDQFEIWNWLPPPFSAYSGVATGGQGGGCFCFHKSDKNMLEKQLNY